MIDGKVDAVDSLQKAAWLAIDEAREPWLRDVEDALQIARFDKSRGVHRLFPALTAARATAAS